MYTKDALVFCCITQSCLSEAKWDRYNPSLPPMTLQINWHLTHCAMCRMKHRNYYREERPQKWQTPYPRSSWSGGAAWSGFSDWGAPDRICSSMAHIPCLSRTACSRAVMPWPRWNVCVGGIAVLWSQATQIGELGRFGTQLTPAWSRRPLNWMFVSPGKHKEPLLNYLDVHCILISARSCCG